MHRREDVRLVPILVPVQRPAADHEARYPADRPARAQRRLQMTPIERLLTHHRRQPPVGSEGRPLVRQMEPPRLAHQIEEGHRPVRRESVGRQNMTRMQLIIANSFKGKQIS